MFRLIFELQENNKNELNFIEFIEILMRIKFYSNDKEAKAKYIS